MGASRLMVLSLLQCSLAVSSPYALFLYICVFLYSDIFLFLFSICISTLQILDLHNYFLPPGLFIVFYNICSCWLR